MLTVDTHSSLVSAPCFSCALPWWRPGWCQGSGGRALGVVRAVRSLSASAPAACGKRGAHRRSARRRAQVGAWLVNLASVIIVGSQINMASVKRSRVVLVHVAVGIALEIIVGVQALIALLVRPSHESPLRQSWNVTHRCTRPRARRAPLSSMHVLRLLSGSTVCVAAQVACMVCTSQ